MPNWRRRSPTSVGVSISGAGCWARAATSAPWCPRRRWRCASRRVLRTRATLTAADFLRIDGRGRRRGRVRPARSRPPRRCCTSKSSRARGAGAVLHTHSVWSTILSERHRHDRGLGHRGLRNAEGPRRRADARAPRVDPDRATNDQDMTRLAAIVRARAARGDPAAHAFLLAGHGLYTWGRTIADAERHVEILEFLLEVLWPRQNPR